MVARGLEVQFRYPGHPPNEDFLALAMGSLVGFELARARGERLEYQVLRLEGNREHAFRLVVRHPDRPLDLGLHYAVHRRLHEIAKESPDRIEHAYHRALLQGMPRLRLRHLTVRPDLWQDDFWNYLG